MYKLVIRNSILNILSSKFNREWFIFSQQKSAETKFLQMNLQFHFPDFALATAYLSSGYILNLCMFSQPF